MEHGPGLGKVGILDCDAVLVLGKELRRFPERAMRELSARAAAAALVHPHLLAPARILTLEAPLRGQHDAGSAIVVRELAALGVAAGAVVRRSASRSTREEALLARKLADDHRLTRMVVVTARYHLPRASQIFAEVLGPGRAVCATPEDLWHALDGPRGAAPEELGTRILAGVPDAAAMQEEARSERWFGRMARLLRPLPPAWRWGVEMGAAVALRGLAHPPPRP